MSRALALLLCVWMGAVGCKTRQSALNPSGPPPSYAEVVERYNQNLMPLEQFWARSVVAMRWVDEDGRRQFEQGEGHFMFRGDQHTALTLGKVGQIVFWIGSDGERVWMIDRHSDPSVTYIQPAERGGWSGLPVNLAPTDVLVLMGLRPIRATTGQTRYEDGLLVVEPDPGAEGQVIRLMLDSSSRMPLRLDILDAQGEVRASCLMADHDQVRVEGYAVGDWPRIPMRYVMEIQGQDASISMSFDGADPSRVGDRSFSLQSLMRAFPTDDVIEFE